MSVAYIRFYAQLNYFLPTERKQQEFPHYFEGRVSIKDMIESLGVPHTEVDLLLANSEPVSFSYLVEDQARISVYPIFESLDITPLIRLRPTPQREPRFVLDVHLGRLAAYLRMLGFDSLYPENYEDEVLAAISSSENRILLTRDRGLLKRKQVIHGYSVRETNPQKQVAEILRRYDLFNLVEPFKRCVHCNGLLEVVSKEEIWDRLQPETRLYYDDFRRCAACNRIYWKGSHYERMQHLIANIMGQIETE